MFTMQQLPALLPKTRTQKFFGARNFSASPKCLAKNIQLNAKSMNPHLANVQYAVRGEIVIRANALQSQISKGEKLPFEQVIYCNIGNPQQLLQTPISFHRQVMALMEYPPLLSTSGIFAPDAITRAKKYLDHVGINGTGPYCHSQGVELVREEVADFISNRDGHPASANDIFLTNGASSGVELVLKIMIRGPEDGIMIPIPQYPLYSASIPLFNGTSVPYYLTEADQWGLSPEELDRSYNVFNEKGITPRALTVINPGNPTGQTLSLSNMQRIVDFCSRKDVVLFADEVYQENVYNDTNRFFSFKKVMRDMGAEIQLISFHSISKGYLGECGKRGGYFEILNLDEGVRAELYKLSSLSLCSNVTGQIMVGLMVNPPKVGDHSYAQFNKEKNDILSSLKRRAEKLVAALNKLEGVSCQPAAGAMYAFPQITLSPKVQEAAKQQNKAPDMLYCIELLENTGICVVPGSGFGQRDGTYHFRTTFLPQEKDIDQVIQRMSAFHAKFMNKYR